MPHSDKKTIKAIENASRDDLVLLMKTIVERNFSKPTKFIKYALLDMTALERADAIETRAATARKIARETAMRRENKKRKRTLEVCSRCEKDFDPLVNNIGSCCYHTSMMNLALLGQRARWAEEEAGIDRAASF